jgi:predicted 2-oxoglutarate/Fe(II)-dependent dioxygenase YbiX
MSIEPKIYAEKIYYYENVINSADDLIVQIEESNSKLTDMDSITSWEPWTAPMREDTYVFGEIKHTDNRKIDTSSKAVASIHRALEEALRLVGADYAKSQGIDYIDPRSISISKYKTGAFMGAHVDDYGEDGAVPVMSAVMYLNDDYEGGELHFLGQDILIKPKAGSVILFPSKEPFYHESLLIKVGIKYMVSAFWVKSNK